MQEISAVFHRFNVNDRLKEIKCLRFQTNGLFITSGKNLLYAARGVPMNIQRPSSLLSSPGWNLFQDGKEFLCFKAIAIPFL